MTTCLDAASREGRLFSLPVPTGGGKSWQIDYLDPTGKRIRKTFEKRGEAEAELAKRVSLIAEGRHLDVKVEYTTTMGEFLDKYEENHKTQKSFQTWKNHCLRNFREYFGDGSLLSGIRYVHLETYRNALRQKPTKSGALRSDASVNREMSCLHHLFTKAVEWEMIDKSPFDRGKRLAVRPAPEAIVEIKTAFASSLERVGIRDFLRHTFASHLVMSGASIKEVQELLGHKTLTMTMRYAHLSQEHKKKAVNLLNKLTA